MNSDKIIELLEAYFDFEDSKTKGKQLKEIIQLAKEATAHFYQDNENAFLLLNKARNLMTNYWNQIKNYPSWQLSPDFQKAKKEYLKAELFGYLIKNKKIGLPKLPIIIEPEEYLEVLTGFIKELTQKADFLAENQKYETLKEIKEIIVNFYVELANSKINQLISPFLNEIKTCIRKIEDTLLDFA